MSPDATPLPTCPWCDARCCDSNQVLDPSYYEWSCGTRRQGHWKKRSSLCVLDGSNKTIAELRAKVERLRAALLPFARVAAGIRDNWPEQCPLRIDQGVDKSGRPGSKYYYEVLSYYAIDNEGRPEDCLTLLPTIREWREAAEAVKEHP